MAMVVVGVVVVAVVDVDGIVGLRLTGTQAHSEPPSITAATLRLEGCFIAWRRFLARGEHMSSQSSSISAKMVPVELGVRAHSMISARMYVSLQHIWQTLEANIFTLAAREDLAIAS